MGPGAHNHEDPTDRSETCPACARMDVVDETVEEWPTVESVIAETTAGRPAVEPNTTAEPVTSGRPAVPVGQTGMIRISEILDDEADNVARGCKKVTETPLLRKFARGMERRGQLHPIRVRPIDPPRDGKRYRLIFGFRRLASARLLGWKEVQASVVKASDSEALRMNWAEGHRTNASTYDIAVGFYLCKKNGQDVAAIAEDLGMNPEDAEVLVGIMERCPPELIEIFKNDCSNRTTLILAQISQIESASPDDTKRLMITAWRENRFTEIQRLQPIIPKRKPAPVKKPVRQTLSLSEIKQLEGQIEDATEWYDPLRGYQPITDEAREFAMVVIEAMKRKQYSLR